MYSMYSTRIFFKNFGGFLKLRKLHKYENATLFCYFEWFSDDALCGYSVTMFLLYRHRISAL